MVDLQLSGKVAVVTGASKGIGHAAARELAAEGADVATRYVKSPGRPRGAPLAKTEPASSIML